MNNEHDDHASESVAIGEAFGRDLIKAMDDAQWTEAQRKIVFDAIERAAALYLKPEDER